MDQCRGGDWADGYGWMGNPLSQTTAKELENLLKGEAMDHQVPYSTVTITVQTGDKTKSVVVHRAKNVVFDVDQVRGKSILKADLSFEAHLDSDGVYYSGKDE